MPRYDEMLYYNDILCQGRVLNYDIEEAYNQLDETTAVWSGYGTDKKALYRPVTFGQELVKTIRVFDKAIKLPFNKKGQFFLSILKVKC